VTGVRSVPRPTLPAGPCIDSPCSRNCSLSSGTGAERACLPPSYAAGSAPVIAHRSAEPAIGREKRITVGQQLGNVHLPVVINSVPCRSSRLGFPGREYATAARQLILPARAGTGCSAACAGAIGRGSRAARIRRCSDVGTTPIDPTS